MNRFMKLLPWVHEEEIEQREKAVDEAIDKTQKAVDRYAKVSDAYKIASIIISSSRK